MIATFPIGTVRLLEPTKRPDGKLCPQTVWFMDTHDAPRGRYTHDAQDIFAPQGSDVLCPELGQVIFVGEGKGGHCLRLYTESDRTYYLAHFRDRPLPRVGEVLAAGALIGFVGRTGNARRTCPHLHIRGARGRDRLVRGVWRRGGNAINLYAELAAAWRRRE